MKLEIRKAGTSDSEFLLELRNDPETRAVSFDSAVVEPEKHSQWLKLVFEDKRRALFVVTLDDQRVGSMRLDLDAEENYGILSWTVAREVRGKGLGTAMVRKFLAERPGCVRARVKKDNIASAKVAAGAGMQLVENVGGVLLFERA